jgi:hypothetical protein
VYQTLLVTSNPWRICNLTSHKLSVCFKPALPSRSPFQFTASNPNLPHHRSSILGPNLSARLRLTFQTSGIPHTLGYFSGDLLLSDSLKPHTRCILIVSLRTDRLHWIYKSHRRRSLFSSNLLVYQLQPDLSTSHLQLTPVYASDNYNHLNHQNRLESSNLLYCRLKSCYKHPTATMEVQSATNAGPWQGQLDSEDSPLNPLSSGFGS